jgi:hypothetical protein
VPAVLRKVSLVQHQAKQVRKVVGVPNKGHWISVRPENELGGVPQDIEEHAKQESAGPKLWMGSLWKDSQRVYHLTSSGRRNSVFFYGVSPSNPLASEAAARVRAKQGAGSMEQ